MKSKVRIAAAATVAGLAALAGLALSSAGQRATQSTAERPLVRTKVIRRTVHVTKHAKPRHPVAASPPATAYGGEPVTTASSGGAAPEPVTTSTSGSAAAEPVTTATSATGAGAGGESEVDYEHEGGGEAADD